MLGFTSATDNTLDLESLLGEFYQPIISVDGQTVARTTVTGGVPATSGIRVDKNLLWLAAAVIAGIVILKNR